MILLCEHGTAGVWGYIHTCIPGCIHTCVYMSVCGLHTCVCMCVCARACVCVCTGMLVCMHVCVSTCTHVCMRLCVHTTHDIDVTTVLLCGACSGHAVMTLFK